MNVAKQRNTGGICGELSRISLIFNNFVVTVSIGYLVCVRLTNYRLLFLHDFVRDAVVAPKVSQSLLTSILKCPTLQK